MIDGLDTQDVRDLKGVGDAMAEKLAKLHLNTVQDLLFHLPIRYQDRTRVVPIGQLHFGDEAVIEGQVTGSEIKMGKRRSLLCRIKDHTCTLCFSISLPHKKNN
jgi:ATP-dependent DNA helicase RecG